MLTKFSYLAPLLADLLELRSCSLKIPMKYGILPFSYKSKTYSFTIYFNYEFVISSRLIFLFLGELIYLLISGLDPYASDDEDQLKALAAQFDKKYANNTKKRGNMILNM